MIVSNVDFNNIRVALKRVFQGGRIGVVDEVAGDVQNLDGPVELEEFGQGLAEHVPQRVRGQRQTFEIGTVVEEIDAQLRPSLVVEPVQFQGQVVEDFVDLQGLGEISGSLVVNLVVGEVQVREDLGREQELGNFSSAGVADLIMGQVELANGFV